MRTSILIVSFLQDLPWLKHCLRSIDKFATGFGETVVLVPEEELWRFSKALCELPLRADTQDSIRLASYHRTPRQEYWHLHHQVMKCRADKWCPDADFVLHTDSDCIFS